MRILFFQEPRGPFGGVTNVIYNLSRALAKNANVTYFPAFAPNKQYFTNLLNAYRRLLINDFDVTHFCINPDLSNGGYGLFKLAKIHSSTVLSVHGIIQYEQILYNLGTNWFWGNSFKGLASTMRYCRLADKIVTYSKFMKKEIVNWYKVKPDKISVIPNGVDVSKFHRPNKQKIFLEGDPAILYLGSLEKFKSPDVLINAIPKLVTELPKLKLHLVGPGDQTSLTLLAKKKGVEKYVLFHGNVDPDSTPFFYQAADFCVFPSRRDTGGITLFEAMASGTPVIASNRGGTPEIISNGQNGILFDPDSYDDLSKAIFAIQNDKEFRKTLINNAILTVDRYSWKNIANEYLTLYKSLQK